MQKKPERYILPLLSVYIYIYIYIFSALRVLMFSMYIFSP